MGERGSREPNLRFMPLLLHFITYSEKFEYIL
jgi:hypothetical protein